MTPTQYSRRAFLRSAGNAARGSCIVLTLRMILTSCERAQEARLGEGEFTTLSAEEAMEFTAIAARIIPTDATPGATEAGVIYFIDKVLGDGREAEHEILRRGLTELQAAAEMRFAVTHFYELQAEQQDRLLTDIEASAFFATIRYLTVAGMFSLPEYGGNRDNIGYQLLGFEDRHVWQSPYGYYDADYADKGA